jgi:LysM repeat protein
MSVATELVPTVTIPAHARLAEPLRRPGRPERPGQGASVTVLHAPADAGTAPLRLTRRGVVVLTVAVLALGVALIWLARLSSPQPAAVAPAPHAVTVQPGDTLWSIASRVAPGRDPRAEVAALQRRNHLDGVQLLPGQVLRVP